MILTNCKVTSLYKAAEDGGEDAALDPGVEEDDVDRPDNGHQQWQDQVAQVRVILPRRNSLGK